MPDELKPRLLLVRADGDFPQLEPMRPAIVPGVEDCLRHGCSRR